MTVMKQFFGSGTFYSMGVVVALLTIGVAQGALAQSIQVDLLNGEDPSNFSCPDRPLPSPIVVSGSGSASAPPGNIQQYGVQIDWGDGSPIEVVSNYQSNPSKGKGPFDYTFETAPHTYPNGSFTISIQLFHTQPGGNDNQVDASIAFDVCTFNPQPAAIQIDSVNGQDPSGITCPDDTIVDGRVAIAGSGQGSAPPGPDVSAYRVDVDWGDGTTETVSSQFTPPSGVPENFDFSFAGAQHTYAASGSYTIEASLVYTDSGGADVVVLSTTADVCVFIPVDPAIQIDLVGGIAPDAIDCGESPLFGPIVVSGSGQGSAPPAPDASAHRVVMDWGDGTMENATASFSPSSGNFVNFDFSYDSPSHEYASGGTYTVVVMLVYVDGAGEDQVVTMASADVCIFDPVAPAIQVDLLNGVDPGTFSCPDNPIVGEVTIDVSGQGSAPPGGDVSAYRTVVDWGDGTAPEDVSSTFTPPAGLPRNFTFTGQTAAHEYAVDGTYMVTLSLVYTDDVGDDQVAASVMKDICVFGPMGTVTGAITDAESGLPLIGALVQDVTEETPIFGSVPGDNDYVIQTTPGLRTIRVRAQGWVDAFADVTVIEDQVVVQDFAMEREITSLNVVEVTLPIGGNSQGTNATQFLVPECVEAIVDGNVVATSCVRYGYTYLFVGLPDGETVFRAANAFYDVEQETKKLDNDERDNGDDAPNKNSNVVIRLKANVPEQQAFTRVPLITGGVTGQISDGLEPVEAFVDVTFDFDGTPVTVTTLSDAGTGVYVADLINPGVADVVAHGSGSSTRSLVEPTEIVGGVFTEKDLLVAPFDAETANFAPIVTNPASFSMDEDASLVVNIDDLDAIDLNDNFSADHTLEVYPGFNYVLSNDMADSSQINPVADFFGILSVSVTVSDGVNSSYPFNILVDVASQPDAVVYVNFNDGLPAGSGGLGTESQPLDTLGRALQDVLPGGTLQLSGGKTTEPITTINQHVTLVNADPGSGPVIIDPN